MFLALNFALSAPVGVVTFALIAAVTTVHPQQVLARHVQPRVLSS